MNKLEKAIILATEAHAGQVDKGGSPYILHPLYIMHTVAEQSRFMPFDPRTREDMICASVLHDVLEDYDRNKYNFNNIVFLVKGCGDSVYNIVKSLTRGLEEDWKDYIKRVDKNPYASFIKIADLEHNCDLDRLNRRLTDKDRLREEKYMKAIEYLEFGEGDL